MCVCVVVWPLAATAGGAARGGATVLKVGRQILRAKRAENFVDPHFLASGGQNIA